MHVQISNFFTNTENASSYFRATSTPPPLPTEPCGHVRFIHHAHSQATMEAARRMEVIGSHLSASSGALTGARDRPDDIVIVDAIRTPITRARKVCRGDCCNVGASKNIKCQAGRGSSALHCPVTALHSSARDRGLSY